MKFDNTGLTRQTDRVHLSARRPPPCERPPRLHSDTHTSLTTSSSRVPSFINLTLQARTAATMVMRWAVSRGSGVLRTERPPNGSVWTEVRVGRSP